MNKSKQKKSLIFIKSSVIALGIVFFVLLTSLLLKISSKELSSNNNSKFESQCPTHKNAILAKYRNGSLKFNDKGQVAIVSEQNEIIILDKCLNIISRRKIAD